MIKLNKGLGPQGKLKTKIGKKAYRSSTVRLTDEQRKLVERNLGLVRAIVKKIRNRTYIKSQVSNEELYQHGCLGLCMASSKWQEGKGSKFSTFAWTYIHGYIDHFVRDQSRVVKIDQKTYENRVKIHRLESQGYSEEEIKEELALSEERFWSAKLSFLEDYSPIEELRL